MATNDFLSAAEPTAYGIIGAVRHNQLVEPTQITMDPGHPQPPDQHSSPACAVGTYPERDRNPQSPDQTTANQKSHPSSNAQGVIVAIGRLLRRCRQVGALRSARHNRG